MSISAAYRLLLLLFLCPVLVLHAASAAEIRLTGAQVPQKQYGGPAMDRLGGNRPCHVELSGPIVEGDLVRLKAAIETLRPDPNNTGVRLGLCLDSPGGSFQEAVKIARTMLGKDKPENGWISRYAAWTVVENGAECLSACAIIFMAGNYYEHEEEFGVIAERYLHARGRLGFHSPYISLTEIEGQSFSRETVENTFDAAVQSVREIAELGESLNHGGANANDDVMPQHLLVQMLLRGRDEIYWIDTVYRATRYRIEVYGIRAPTRFGPKEYCYLCTNKHYPDLKEGIEYIDCDGPQTSKGKVRGSGQARQIWLDGHGAEGAAYCVVQPSARRGELPKIHYELVADQRRKLGRYDFHQGLKQHFYAPSARLEDLAQ
jgi:hypothetical protein